MLRGKLNSKRPIEPPGDLCGLNHRGDIFASGKTRRVASTEGNVGVKDANRVEVKIGLNVYVKPDI